MNSRHVMPFVIAVAFLGCGGGEVKLSTAKGLETSSHSAQKGDKGSVTAEVLEIDRDKASLCDANKADRESSEYDTSGDQVPDVRKVFRRIGTPPLARLVLICRESDLNADGTKDVVRYYNDEGRPLREEADRDFNGQMDSITIFQNGQVVRQEMDKDGNGIIDLKLFYDGGKILRSESDVAGRSTAKQWKPDRWEYYEGSRMIRMGIDLDGDGRVDRWDRDEEFKREQEASEASAAEEEEKEKEESEEELDKESDKE